MAAEKKRRFRPFRALVIFLVGVATGIYFFGPERPTVEKLLNPKARSKVVDFHQAKERAGAAADMAGYYASKAGDYITTQIKE